MDDPTSCLPVFSKAGGGRWGRGAPEHAKRGLCAAGEREKWHWDHVSMLANQEKNRRNGSADVYGDFLFLLISGEEHKAGRNKRRKERKKKSLQTQEICVNCL